MPITRSGSKLIDSERSTRKPLKRRHLQNIINSPAMDSSDGTNCKSNENVEIVKETACDVEPKKEGVMESSCPAKKSKQSEVENKKPRPNDIPAPNVISGEKSLHAQSDIKTKKTDAADDDINMEEHISKSIDQAGGDGDKPETSKHGKMSLKVHTQNTPLKQNRGTYSEKLQTLLSNMYLNATQRLCLDFPPRCSEDLAFCHKHHYQRSQLPEAPCHSQSHNLRCALQQQRYVSFVNSTLDMCHRGEFPGEGIFTKIIELLLSLNSRTYNNASLCQSYVKCIELFSVLVRTFPPCWLSMRSFYNNFFQKSIDLSKIAIRNKSLLPKSNKIFDIVLDLLEYTMEKCSEDDLKQAGCADSVPPSVEEKPMTKSDGGESIACSEFYNQWEWEKQESCLQTFEALSDGSRLDRLLVILRLLLQILESDFVMWILHHHKKTKDWIFCKENRPLVVAVFEMTSFTRLTGPVKRIFNLFAKAVNRSLNRASLQILERYIALFMVTSNTADMENTVIGVKYPYLGAETKDAIWEFFKMFKAHNTSKVSTYINTIDLLRIPYVRYEFVNHFLKLFYFSSTEDMSPKKIAYEMAKKRWLKYKPQSELQNSDEDLSREQYLQLLLLSLKAYSDWHGSRLCHDLIVNNKSISGLKTSADSAHRWPTHGSGKLVLKKMAKDMQKLEQQLKMTVRVSKPKVDLPMADICIDEEVITKYRNDLKFIMAMHNILPKQSVAHADVDFKEWLQFLKDFTPNS